MAKRAKGPRKRSEQLYLSAPGQPAMVLPPSDWTVPDVTKLPDIPVGTPVALDLETYDPYLKTMGPGWCFPQNKGRVVGVSLAWQGSYKVESIYLPFSHEDALDNLTPDETSIAMQWLAKLLADPARVIHLHSAQYDTGWWTHFNIPWHAQWRDVAISAALLDEYRVRFNLDALGEAELGVRKDERLLRAATAALGLHEKSDLWRLPARYVGSYAEQDARVTLALAAKFGPMLEAQGLTAASASEHRLMRECLIPMRARGIRVDVEAAARDRERLLKQRAKLARATGTSKLDVWSPSLGIELDRLGLPLPKTPTGKFSVTRPVLEALAGSYPIAANVLALRRLDKLVGTFITGYIIERANAGRIHPEFHPLRSDEGGAVTGRLSSSSPNAQNLSRVKDADDPDDAGRMVRGYFLPEENEVWAAADFSQQEPRVALSYAYLLGLRGSAALVERYRADPKTDIYQLLTEGAGITRTQSKTNSLGRLYGRGNVAMAASMGFPLEVTKEGKTIAGPEGQAVIDAFDNANPWMRGLSRAVERHAEKVGYLRSLGGRRLRLRHEDGTPCMQFGEAVAPYKLTNRLVQGGAADMIKAAMLALVDAGLGSNLRVSVHDECGLSIPHDSAVLDTIRHAMVHAIELVMPSAVDIETGENWGAAK